MSINHQEGLLVLT